MLRKLRENKAAVIWQHWCRPPALKVRQCRMCRQKSKVNQNMWCLWVPQWQYSQFMLWHLVNNNINKANEWSCLLSSHKTIIHLLDWVCRTYIYVHAYIILYPLSTVSFLLLLLFFIPVTRSVVELNNVRIDTKSRDIDTQL